MTQTLSNQSSANSLNIWEQSAKFAASKNRSKNSTNSSNYTFNTPPNEEHASCTLEDNIPNYLGDEN